jgi:hypothetical protein
MKLWKRIVLVALAALLLLFAFAACTDEEKETETDEYTPLSPTEQEELNQGIVLEPGVETPVIFR